MSESVGTRFPCPEASAQRVEIDSLLAQEREALARTVEECRSKSERLDRALDASDMGCWDVDLIGNRVNWLGAMEKLFGFEKGTFPGSAEAFFARIHPDDVQRIAGELRKAVDGRLDYEQEYRLLLPNGDVRWVLSRGRATYDEQGTPLRMTGTCIETTRLKSQEDVLRSAKTTAENSSALKSAFLANMSHEIRTPLGVIMGFSELLADPDLDPAERSEYMGVIARNGQHLSRLIDDILDLSKVEAGKLEVQRTSLSLKPALDEVISGLQLKAFEKGIRLELETVGALPAVIHTDAVRFKQIIINLAGNALKFTDRGEVKVIAVFDPSSQSLRIRVQDSGHGISLEGQAKLFQPFTQADPGPNRKSGGTGLGLALSRRIARTLGGEVVLVSSAPGRGSTFEFSLPAVLGDVLVVEKPLPASEVAPGAIAAPKPLEGLKVLLVEDTPDNQILMDRILRRRGAELSIAGNGEEALEVALKKSFDLVLMDIQMPVLDGYEATRILRERGFKAPIIALTAHAMKEERLRCMEAGCDDHLSKPVNPRDLVEVLLRHAQRVGREPALGDGPHQL